MKALWNILPISGFGNEPVPNRFLRQERNSGHLAIFLPGLDYTNHMPLMYYIAKLLECRGADILRVDYAYQQQPEFGSAPFAKRMQHLSTDVTAAYCAALAQRAYDRITLVGKSFGTLAMGHLLASAQRPSGVHGVWLTPLLQNARLREQIKQVPHQALFVIGTADPFYDAGMLKELETATSGKSVIIPDADHGLEINSDLVQTLQALQEIVRGVENFIGSIEESL